MALPPLQHVAQVQVRLNLVRQLGVARLAVVGRLAVDVERRVARAMAAALDLVQGPQAGHADVDGRVDPVALVCVTEGRRQAPHGPVADAHRLRVDEDADRPHAGVLGPRRRREVRRQALGDLPRRVDRVLVSEGCGRQQGGPLGGHGGYLRRSR